MHLKNQFASEHDSKAITSAELFDGLREIIILHASEKYILRITSTGKLILTK